MKFEITETFCSDDGKPVEPGTPIYDEQGYIGKFSRIGEDPDLGGPMIMIIDPDLEDRDADNENGFDIGGVGNWSTEPKPGNTSDTTSVPAHPAASPAEAAQQPSLPFPSTPPRPSTVGSSTTTARVPPIR